MAYVSRGEKELRRDYPFTSGLTGGDDSTEKQTGRNAKLMPTLGTQVLRRNRIGIK